MSHQPHPTDEQVIADFEKYVNAPLAAVLKFTGFDSTEVSAEGCIVTDSTGRRFLDCLGGYGTMSCGHTHPRIVAAVKEQLDKMAFSSRMLFNAPQAALAKKLAEITPGELECTFFCNSGTEATEAALKIARKYTGRSGFVSAVGAYHGKTMGGLSVSGREKYKKPFLPLVPDCTQVPFNDIAALEAAVDENTAAVLLEPIQGEGGIIIPDAGYLNAARAICDQHGALLIMDEVQTGFGRTGKLWGCNWDGALPDLMLMAKALSGGCIPVGAVIGTAKTWTVFEENPLIHSTTFGGNPLACAAGLAAIDVIETEGLVERSRVQGEKMMAQLRATEAKYPRFIKEVRGRGLIIGFEFSHEDVGALLVGALAQRDVLSAYSLNNPTVIRFEPPLTISDEEVAWATGAFAGAMEQTAELLDDLDIDSLTADE